MDKLASYKPEVRKLDAFMGSYLYKQFIDELQPEAWRDLTHKEKLDTLNRIYNHVKS